MPSAAKRVKVVCELCTGTFANDTVLRAHQHLHTGQRPFSCPHCAATYISVSHLNQHVKEVHDRTSLRSCSVCGKESRNDQTHQRHLLTHTTDRAHLCLACGKGFKSLRAVHLHSKQHERKPSLPCPLCPQKLFVDRRGLAVHQRRHEGAKRFACTLCP